MPTGSLCTGVVSVRTLGDTTATEKTIGSIRDGHSENSKSQVGPFRGLLALLPILHLADRVTTPALLIDGISGIVPCLRGANAQLW